MGFFIWGHRRWAFLVAFCLLAVPSGAWAVTRAPDLGTGEFSLLYWRYLCRGQPQSETTVNASGRESSREPARRELSCPLQRWKVRTLPGADRVIEVVEDAT
jgi:hypothetical protein